MRFHFILIAYSALSTLAFGANAQKDTTSSSGLFSAALNTPKMMAARHEYSDNNMRGALTLYREILATDPNNPAALYGTAQCHYNLKKYSLALEYLDKAVNANAEVSNKTNYFYGEIYHRTGKLDKAIEAFDNYCKSTKSNAFDHQEALRHIKECRFAQEMINNPADVQIENLGVVVNTRFDDYAPSITADGKMLVFTSRRNDTKGGKIDEQGDYKFFEDVYYTVLDEQTGTWTNAVGVEGELNTETYDAVLSIFPDGTGMYVYKNTVNTTGDIYLSRYNKGEGIWQAAEKMPRPINTSYFEGSISMTEDGNTVYFISERPEGYGQGDVYVSTKKGSNWSAPKNLGKVINTDLDEKFVFVHPNGRTLYFSSNGHPTMGSYDIFKTEYVNGEWSVPINLGYPINTVNEESTFTLTKDNQALFIAAEYDNSYGERDIYRIDVSKYPLLSSGYDSNSFGQILCTVTDMEEKPVKDALVRVYKQNTSYMIFETKTDKLGRAKVNLPGNLTYKVVISIDEMIEEREVHLKLKKDAETVEKVNVRF